MAANNPSKANDSKGKLDYKYHLPKDYKTVFLPDEHSSFITRVQEIYSTAVKGVKGNNMPKWAKCCKTMGTKACFRALGHPSYEYEDLKTILVVNNIQNDTEFITFMRNTLPRDEDRNILLPQINMRHPEAANQPENHPQDPEPANLVIPEEPAHNNQIQLQEQYQAVAEQNEKLSQEAVGLRREVDKLKVVSL